MISTSQAPTNICRKCGHFDGQDPLVVEVLLSLTYHRKGFS
jgi:hypothetical protein